MIGLLLVTFIGVNDAEASKKHHQGQRHNHHNISQDSHGHAYVNRNRNYPKRYAHANNGKWIWIPGYWKQCGDHSHWSRGYWGWKKIK